MERVFDQRHRRRYLMAVVVAAALIGLDSCIFAPDAHAQCSARTVLQNYGKLRPAAAPRAAPVEITSAAATPVWKTIAVGTTASTWVLRNALDAAGCGVGDLAEQILARPAFTVSRTRIDVDLVSVSAADLGLGGKTASLATIHAQAQRLGFELAAAEIGPQLRLQYVDQPIGEFQHIGMEPMRTWDGVPVILVVANGGAGLILIGQQAEMDAEIPLTSRFVFVRRRDIAAK